MRSCQGSDKPKVIGVIVDFGVEGIEQESVESLDLLSVINVHFFSSVIDNFDSISLCYDHTHKWKFSLWKSGETNHVPGRQQSYKNC